VIVLGVLLLVVVAVVVIAAVVAGDDPAQLNLVGASIDTTVRWIFITGAISLLVFVAGVALLAAGSRRARGRRREVKQLKAAAGPDAERHTDPPPSRGGHGARETQVREERGRSSTRPVSPQDPDEQTHFESSPRD